MRLLSFQEAQQLPGADRNNAEQQVQTDFGGAAHTQTATAVVVFKHGVDAFGGAAFVVAAFFRRSQRRFVAAATIGIDDRPVAELFGELMNFFGVVGGVHQVIKIRHALGAHLRQRNRGLRVVRRGRGQDRADRDVAVDHVQMQFVTFPVLDFAFAVFLAPPVAGIRKIDQVLRQFAPGLQLQPPGRQRFAVLIFLRTTAFFLRLIWLCFFGFRRSFFTRLNRRRVAADMPGQFLAAVILYHRLMHQVAQISCGEFRECVGESRLARQIVFVLPAAQPPQARTAAEVFDQQFCCSQIIDRFGDERLGKINARLFLASAPVAEIGSHLLVERGELADRDELFLLVRQRPQVFLQHGIQEILDARPKCGESAHHFALFLFAWDKGRFEQTLPLMSFKFGLKFYF